MKSPLEVLQDAKTERFVWVDYTADEQPMDMSLEEPDGTATLALEPGLSDAQLSELEDKLPAPLPADIRSLLASCAGFSLGAYRVSFSRYNDWSYDFLLPHVMVLTDDGTGNDWVIEIHPESGDWEHVWYQCHDPQVTLYQCRTLCDLIEGVLDLSRFEKCQLGHRSILHDPSQLARAVTKREFEIASNLRDSSDPMLRSFVADLPDSDTVIDLRDPSMGDGFDTCRVPRNQPVKRFGQEMLFAYTARPTLWQRLFGK